MANTTYITFGNVITNKNGSPVLPVNTVTCGRERTYYLMFFRSCSFQVSMTPEGEGDAGSTNRIPTVGLNNADILFAFAVEALSRFGSNAYSDLRFSLNMEKQYQLYDFVKLVIDHQ